ncbi:phage major capsid protein [Streptomyces sp. NPDC102340]|uniref:phage major capsid protein n=1 Tax=unclassified Streptomyces TaxID=2593676 RepID=UPI003801A05A
MSAYLSGLIRERAQLGEAAKNTYDQAAEAKRELSTEERTNVEKWEKRCSHLDTEIERLTELGEASQKFGALAERAGVVVESRRETAKPKAEVQHRSAGARFTASEAFKSYSGRGSSQAFELGADWLRQRAAITTAITNGDPAMWWSGPPEPSYTTPFLDLLGRVATSQGTVEFMQHGADPIAELVPEGELKPEATITLEMFTLTLDTFAHWEAITRQALADIPRIESIIDGQLRRGVLRKLEQEAAAKLAGAATVPTLTIADGQSALGLIRAGVAQVQGQGFQPNTLLMNPADLATLDMDAMATTLNGPQSTPSYWGLTPVTSDQVPAGEAYVGDFKSGETWFDRTGTEVFLSDSHADFFIRNQLVILAEARAAFAVTEPRALSRLYVAPETPAE